MFSNLLSNGPNGLGPVGQLFAGINQGQNEQTVLSNLATADVNRQNTLGRLQMDQAMHPGRLEELRLQNVGRDLTNQGTRTANQSRDLTLLRDRVSMWSDAVGQGEDPHEAATRYGVPPKLADRFNGLSEEQRQVLLNRMAVGTMSQRAAEEASNRTSAREEAKDRRRAEREEANQRRLFAHQLEMQARKDAARLEQLLAQAQQNIKQPNFQQQIVQLIQRQRDVQNQYAQERVGGMSADRAAAYAGTLNAIEQDLQRVYAAAIGTASAAGQARNEGNLQVLPGGGLTQRPGAPQNLRATEQTNQTTNQSVPQQKPRFAKNPQTGERIMSYDGGQTWQPAQ